MGGDSLVVTLHPHIYISQTLNSLLVFLNNNGYDSKINILILSHSLIKDLSLFKNKFNVKNEKYDDYIWNFCVSTEVKYFPLPGIIDFYTIQEIEDENGKLHDNAITYLSNMENNKSNGDSISLIIGSGGIGKTSLCHSLANKLETLYSDYLIIFISSEDIKNLANENVSFHTKISSLYDLYQMESKYLENENVFDENTFNACILSGKIITIIDGLDELDSVFNESFNLNSFLRSIADFNSELGDSYFIMTSREDVGFSSELLDALNINKLTLLGFNIKNCKNYLSQRFNKYHNSERIVNAIYSKINDSSLLEEQRVVPFFVDVISTMYEDGLSDGDENLNFDLIEEVTPYPSLNKLNDYLIYSIFRREKTRHNLSESVASMVKTFMDLCSDFHDSWSIDDFNQTIALSYEKNVDEYISQVKKNPLLITSNNRISLRYSFLKLYFITLELYSYFLNGVANDTFIRLINRINNESKEINDISFFVEHSENYEDNLKEMINYLKGRIIESSEHYENTRSNENVKAIEKIIFIAYVINKNSPSKFTELIKYLYSENSDGGEISKLFINGDVHCMDFSNLNVKYSQFKNYSKFLNSNFLDAKFEFCKFHHCHNKNIKNSNITEAFFDQRNCEMNDLSESISIFNHRVKADDEKVREDLKSMLSCFYRAGNFRDLKKEHISFSLHVDKLRESEFNKVLRNGFIVIGSEKVIGNFYIINKEYRNSVRKFIMDGVEDSKIKDIIKWIKE